MKKLLLLIILSLGSTMTIVPSILNDNIIKDHCISWYNYQEEIRYQTELNRFIDKLGYDESRNNWTAINKIGALGEFQFMETTLKQLGYNITVNKFKKDPSIFPPELQREALKELIEYNSLVMNDFLIYERKVVGGIVITKAGILAACHLGGPGSVQLFLTSDGRVNRRDCFGTAISDYLYKYQIYDLNLRLITN